MTEISTLYSKEGFVFSKKSENNYNISFMMENSNLMVSKIIDFNLVKLMYELNTDIYENYKIQLINDNEAIFYFLIKNLFEDIGFSQRYIHLHINKITKKNNIQFISQTIKTEIPEDIPHGCELLYVENFTCSCDILTQHKVSFSFNILFKESMIVPPVLEKLVGLILFKIFKRVKQFIENIRM